jgi:hypothetical protein
MTRTDDKDVTGTGNVTYEDKHVVIRFIYEAFIIEAIVVKRKRDSKIESTFVDDLTCNDEQRYIDAAKRFAHSKKNQMIWP